MANLHGVLKAARRDAANTRLAKHGWLDGATRPPADNAERANSLDWLGGGARTFSIPLETVSAPGAIVAYGFIGWTVSDGRAQLLRDAIAGLAVGVDVKRLGTETALTDLVWWTNAQASFQAGIASLVIPLQIQEQAP